MVARDPIRKVTLRAHPEFDKKKEGADRFSDPHVGSTTSELLHEPGEDNGHVSGTSSSEVYREEDDKSSKSKKKD